MLRGRTRGLRWIPDLNMSEVPKHQVPFGEEILKTLLSIPDSEVSLLSVGILKALCSLAG